MRFQVRETEIPAVREIRGPRFGDARGAFLELWRAADFRDPRIGFEPVQENLSHSRDPGTVRGLHFQRPPHAQAKLVRVLHGAVFDVAVDLREDGDTYGRWVSRELSAADPLQLLVPRGFAHGFCTLVPDTVVAYLVDAYYDPGSEEGVHWRSPELGIPWPELEAYRVSERDQGLPAFGGG